VPTYLVERYWPGVTSELLLEALNRGRQVMRQMSGEGTCVRDISCILIPGEEVVFSVYEGPSAAAVRQLNERARIPVSRLVEAIAVTDDQASLALADQMALTLSILSSKQHRQTCGGTMLKLIRSVWMPSTKTGVRASAGERRKRISVLRNFVLMYFLSRSACSATAASSTAVSTPPATGMPLAAASPMRTAVVVRKDGVPSGACGPFSSSLRCRMYVACSLWNGSNAGPLDVSSEAIPAMTLGRS
jgi:hypothetical protein